MQQPAIVLNPDPRIERVALGHDRWCYVIDDALLDPQALVDHAVRHRTSFGEVDFNAYPGILLPTPGPITSAIGDFFAQHLRRLFDARRVVHMHTRLALVTLPPERLQPYQEICHRDSEGIDPGHSIQASVLYLFKDATLGGTSFYDIGASPQEAVMLFHDSNTLTPDQFHRRHPDVRGYLAGSNRYFTRVASVPARWNRLIFYDGSQLHSGDITAPDRLSADPRLGRLTLNGFFTSRRRAS